MTTTRKANRPSSWPATVSNNITKAVKS